MWVWPQLVFGGRPPIPPCKWRTLPSSQTPSLPALSFPLAPTPPLALFARPREGAAQACGGGGGVLRRKGVEGGGPQSGAWGQTHIWGYSTFPCVTHTHNRLSGLGLAALDPIASKVQQIVKNEKPAQRGSFWDGCPADIRGSFARISRPKTSVSGVKILEKQAFWRGRP